MHTLAGLTQYDPLVTSPAPVPTAVRRPGSAAVVAGESELFASKTAALMLFAW